MFNKRAAQLPFSLSNNQLLYAKRLFFKIVVKIVAGTLLENRQGKNGETLHMLLVRDSLSHFRSQCGPRLKFAQPCTNVTS